MKEPQNLDPVIRNSLCIGCGACTAAEPELRLRLNPDSLMYEPASSGGVDAASVCPSIEVDYARLQTIRFGQATARSMGVVESILLAQSMDRERNLRASSGGVIREIILERLSRREIDGVIALSHRHGICFEPDYIRSSGDVDRLPASIYHNVPFDNALKIIMGQPARYALVATPCQLEGIYKLIYTFRPDLAERVALSIGLICGWTYSHHAIKAICTFTGIDFDRIENIAYRGAGPVGRLRIETPMRTKSISRRRSFHYIVAFDRSFNLPRCHLCVNHLNYLADIVVGDAWLSRVAGTTAGVSLVICRAKKTTDIMNRISEAGNIRLAEAGEADLVESQSRNFVYGDFAYAYARYLESIGQFTPRLIGPNREAAVLPSIAEVSRFHRTCMRKVRLQQQGAYRRLWIRKLFFDVAGYAWRLTRKLFRQAPSRSTLRKPDSLSCPAGPFR